MKKMLLISNSTNFGEAYLGWCTPLIENFLAKTTVKRILFVPYAGINIGSPKTLTESYDNYEKRVQGVFAALGYEVYSVHHEANPVAAVEQAECIMVGGGNTFHLVYELHRNKLIDPIRQKVENGTPYMGWSAGSNIASPTLCTTNDMPVVQPESFRCLGLIPFQINPHYLDANPEMDKLIKHGGETRQDRLNEYMAVNKTMKVVGLREGCALVADNNRMILRGGRPMIVFEYGKQPFEIAPLSEVNL